MTEGIEMQGGAKVVEVTIEPAVPERAESEATVNVVTTAPGTMGPGGIVAVGTKATIEIGAYSSNWMKPATKADAAKLAKKT